MVGDGRNDKVSLTGRELAATSSPSTERSAHAMTHRTENHVLVAGGGVAALEAALALRELGDGQIDVELLAPEPHFWYRPLAVAEPFGRGHVRRFDLGALAAAAGATFTHGELTSVDTIRRIAYTAPGGPVEYSALLVACGTVAKPAIDGALTFRGPADTETIQHLLAEIEAGTVESLVFAAPAGAIWSLPVYELALLTAGWLGARGIAGVELTVVTPEEEPLQLFGPDASAAVRALLDEHAIRAHVRTVAAEARPGELLLVGGGAVPADRVVALPRLQGPRIGGIPQTLDGFVPVDRHGRVTGLADVYAAGDITTFPVKQGGIATQQADAAAESIAAAAGVAVEPVPFRPVLRGMLLTGDGPRFLRSDLEGGMPDGTQVSTDALWWPPAKIVGRHLAPFLAEQTGEQPPAEPPEGIPVEIELDAAAERLRRDRIITAAVEEALRDRGAATVGERMRPDPLVVAPEDTIGEIAERMSTLDVGVALVAEYGRLIGILTARDMLRTLADRAHPSDARARTWMTADPITVVRTTSLEAAGILMTEHDIHHLPVVEGERPVGTIELGDVARRRGAVPMEIGLGF
jgi:sulfide:quinone oxidoreductase